MIVCEYEFERPDPKNLQYSLVEVDIYGWILKEFWSEVRDHRLSLRKNLKTGKFELYRHYYADDYDEVIFTGSLEECLRKSGSVFTLDGLGSCQSLRLISIGRQTSALHVLNGVSL